MTETVTQKSPEGCHSRNEGEEGLAPPGVGSENKGNREANGKKAPGVNSPSEDAPFLNSFIPNCTG